MRHLHQDSYVCLVSLCCSADGNYEVTLMTKATVYNNGMVVWQPPAVYKSSCSIDVEFFPYDMQTCVLKLGSWTYDGFKVTVTWRMATMHSMQLLAGSIKPRYSTIFIHYVWLFVYYYNQCTFWLMIDVSIGIMIVISVTRLKIMLTENAHRSQFG